MGKARNFFIKIDQFIFNQLDQIKNEAGLQKIADLMLNLTDEQQKIFSQLLVFIFILFPYIIVSILYFSNVKYRKNIELKNQIIEQLSFLNGNKDTLRNVSDRFITSGAIQAKDELENRIINVVSRYQITPTKIQIQNFNIISQSSNLTKIEAKINFNNFGTSDFANFMRELIEMEKFKIVGLSLNKLKDTDLLQGNIEIRHIGKSSNY